MTSPAQTDLVATFLACCLAAFPAGARATGTVELTGQVLSRHDMVVSCEVSGRLMDIVEEGTRVATGDTIAVLDSSEMRLDLRAAEQALELARLEVERTEKRLARASTLADSNIYSRVELEELQLDHEVAASKARLAQVTVERARLRLNKARISSPIDAVVMQRMHRTGEYLAATEPLVRLLSEGATEIEVHAPLMLLEHVRPGVIVEVRHASGSTSARVDRVIGGADAPARQFRFFLLDHDAGLPVGEAVQVLLPQG